jgi:peptidoglycan/LPS O-acetylase OafA/YrhL
MPVEYSTEGATHLKLKGLQSNSLNMPPSMKWSELMPNNGLRNRSMTASHPHLSHPEYRPDIDGLRAVAVLSVVAFHAFPNWIAGGFIGVDVFFVISGFLISTIIMQNLDKGTFSFVEFYVRRIKRIFPALLVVLGVSYAFSWFALLSDEYKQLGEHIAAGAGFISNFVLWNEAGYFDDSAETKPLLHLWSLGIEEQFYIVWPLLLWGAWKYRFNLLSVATVVALISFVLNLKGVRQDPVAAFYSPQTRFWELLSGSIVAWCSIHGIGVQSHVGLRVDGWLVRTICGGAIENDGRTLSNALSCLGGFLLAYGFWQINSNLAFPGKWAVVPAVGAVLIIVGGRKAWLNRAILSNNVAVWFGLISFPLYLWHWPILSFIRIIEENPPHSGLKLVAIFLSVVLAWTTFRYLEKPIRSSSDLHWIPLILLGAMLIVGAVGWHTYRHDGHIDRLANLKYKDIQLLFSKPQLDAGLFSCADYIPALDISSYDSSECKVFQPRPPDVVFIGDSHVGHWAKAIAAYRAETSIAMVQGNSCLPFASSGYSTEKSCRDRFDALVDYLKKDSHVQVLVLSAFWNKAISSRVGEKGKGWRLGAEPTAAEMKSFMVNMDEFMDAALRHNRKVVFMYDVPHLHFDIRDCFDFRPIRLTEKDFVVQDCSVSRASVEARDAVFKDILESGLSKYTHVAVYDPFSRLCVGDRCLAKLDGKPLYFNGDHVNIEGANMVIPDLLSQRYFHGLIP